VFFLAEYANMILIAGLTAIMFLGGWLSPFPFLPDGFFWMRPRCRLRAVPVPLVPRHLPALSLRPDHAPGLEGVHPGHPGLDPGGRGRRLGYLFH
jgi:hypothetical protein